MEDKQVLELGSSIQKTNQKIEDLQIKTKEEFDNSQKLLKEVKDLEKMNNSLFDPGINAQKKALKILKETKDQFAIPLKKAKESIQKKQKQYYFEQEEIRLAEERRLREKKRKAEEARKLEELERIEAEKEKLKAAGADEEILKAKEEEMAKTFDEEISVPQVEIRPIVQVDKRSFRKIYKYRIVNESLIPDKYKSPDDKKIMAVVRQDKENTNIPGIEVYYE